MIPAFLAAYASTLRESTGKISALFSFFPSSTARSGTQGACRKILPLSRPVPVTASPERSVGTVVSFRPEAMAASLPQESTSPSPKAMMRSARYSRAARAAAQTPCSVACAREKTRPGGRSSGMSAPVRTRGRRACQSSVQPVCTRQPQRNSSISPPPFPQFSRLPRNHAGFFGKRCRNFKTNVLS